MQGASYNAKRNKTTTGWGNKAEDWQNLGRGIASEITNSQLIKDSWELTSGADYSTPMGWVEGAVGVVGGVAGVIDGAANVVTLGGKAAVTTGLKSGLKHVAENAAEIAAREGVEQLGETGLKKGTQEIAESASDNSVKSGVYHVEAKGEKYTGSAEDIDGRMSTKKHPARDLIDDPNAKIEKFPVDISDLNTRTDKNRTLRVAEQDVMDAKGNIPLQDGSRNRRRALTPKKQEKYRQNYDVDRRKR